MSSLADIRTHGSHVRRLRPVAGQMRHKRSWSVLWGFLVLALFIGMSVLFLAVPNKPELILGLGMAVTVVLTIIRWPAVGTYLTMFLAIMFDTLPSPWVHSPIAEAGIFRNLSQRGLPQALWLSPFELLMLLSLASILVRHFHARQRSARGPVWGGIMVYTAIVLFGEVNGILTGGDFKISLWEVRPLLYIVGLYVLAVNTIKKPKHVTLLIWVTVITIGLRCLDGVSRYLSMTADVRAIAPVVLEHEDSLFLVAALAMLVPALLWRKRLPRQLLPALIILAPLVLYVIAINHRRAAYFCLILALLAMVPLIWVSLPSRAARQRMVQVLAVIAVATPAYIGAFWNSTSSLGEPAQAIRSIIAPNERDYLSNLYRDQENANLRYTIGLSPIAGIGFGKPMQIISPMVDLTSSWALQLYMPHNNMLWLWMRMGLVGFAIFWMMVGSSILLVSASLRLGIARYRYLISEETRMDEALPHRHKMTARGLSGDVPGLRVVRMSSRASRRWSSAEDVERKLLNREIRECVEFLFLAFLCLGVLVSMLTIAVVDQGLMSFRISTYWGLVLGTLAAGWQMYKVKYRSSIQETVKIEVEKETQRAARIRLRVVPGTQLAP